MPVSQLNDKSIFNAAREIDSEEARRDYLQRVCGGDLEQFDRVAALLEGFHKNSRFLESPAVNLMQTSADPVSRTLASPVLERPGTQIGPYIIREQLGEGGMGVVYVAEQTEPVRRQVALKIIKPGMDSKEVLARFDAERQALAMMSHPNIAKILDGGTTEARRPYFVMELVRGVSIAKYCDNQKLNTRQRLELFVTVCQAVQHAHLKGIIHRDLKPSNILVELHDVTAVPKVIDFGVAKATHQRLTQQTVYTQFSQMLGTPLYMSPEQAQLSGLDIDTRSDVYSLGVVLYELLTGSTPFEKSLATAGYDEMRRIIQEDEPPRPSYRISTLKAERLSTLSERQPQGTPQLERQVERELDWIVMKALEKDRVRRYESTSALAADVQRYLNGDLVHACPPSVGYRLQKYVRRHKGLLATAALLITTLLIATGVSVAYALQADQARRMAQQQGDAAVATQKLAEKHLQVAMDAIDKLLAHASSAELAEIPQAQPIRKKILEDALAFYDQFRATSGDSPGLRFRAAAIRTWYGDLAAELQQPDLALKAYEDALVALTDLQVRFPDEVSYRDHLAITHMHLGWFYAHTIREPQQAIDHFQKARAKYDSLAKLSTNERHAFQFSSIKAKQAIALTHEAMGDKDRCRVEMLAAYEELNQLDRSRDDADVAIGVESALARVLQSTNPGRAEAIFLETIEKSRQRYRKTGKRSHRHWHIHLLLNAEEFLREQNVEETGPILDEAVELSEKLLEEFPSMSDHAYLRVESVQRKFRALAARVPSDPNEQAKSDFLRRFPDILEIHTRSAEILAASDAPIEALTNAIGRFPKQSAYYRLRGELYRNRGDFALALSDFDRATETRAERNMRPFESRGKLFHQMEEYSKAIDDFTTYLNTYNSWHIYKRRAVSFFRLRRYDDAISDLKIAMELDHHQVHCLKQISPQEIAACPDPNFRNDFLKLVDHVVELNDDSSAALTTRADIMIAFGYEQRALLDLRKVTRGDDASSYVRYKTNVLALHLADVLEYQTGSAQMLTAFAASDLASERYYAAWTCALAPAAIEDYAPAITLARHAVEKEPGNQQYLNGLGAILMRSGQYDDAKVELEKALAADDTANTSQSYIRYFLAMTEHQLGHDQAAQEQLEIANASAEEELAGTPSWNRKLTLQLLQKETETLIGKP